MRTFEQIFRREQVNAALIEGDSFHRKTCGVPKRHCCVR
jgi:phosphoribulokinase